MLYATNVPPTFARTQDELVWKILFDRQTALLHRRTVAAFADGARALGLDRARIPDISELDRRLFRLTGWHAVAVSGRLSDAEYFALLSRRTLPVTTRLRSPREFEFAGGPDLFHDVFGHMPLLVAEPAWARYLEDLGRLAQRRSRDEAALRSLTRAYWHTAEFGLIRELGQVRAIGAGLLSSTGELHYALSDEAARQAFDLDGVLATAFRRDTYQPAYFVLPDWDALADATADLAARLAEPSRAELVRVLAAR